jgi:hypothetical protein
MKNISIIFIFLFIIINSFSQEIIVVDWAENIPFVHNDDKIIIPSIKNQEFIGNNARFYFSKQINKNTNYKIKINSIQKSIATNEDKAFINFFKIDVKNELEYEFKCVNSRNERFSNFIFLPYVMENNQIYRINQISYDLETIGIYQTKKNTFVDNSVLADNSSKWYKVAVTSSGIYKLDKAWFQTNGIDINSVSPQSIHIYGNGEGKLSEHNGSPKVDDLTKNALLFIGNNNQVFEDNEYLLFYAKGPHKIIHSAGTFTRMLNIYDDNSYYFIRIASHVPPTYINQIASTNSSVFQNVTTYDYHDIYEKELVNLVGGGQRWYGELFDVDLSKDFSFSIPNLSNEAPIKFRASFASTKGMSQNTINFSINGTTLNNSFLNSGKIDYIRQEVNFEYNSTNSTIPIKITVNRNNPSVLTYLDKIELNARRNLVFIGNQMHFRDFRSVSQNNFAKFTIQNVTNSSFVWDVTDKSNPKIIEGNFNSGVFDFIVSSDSLREFICSNGSNYASPSYINSVVPQNLHGLASAQLLIVTHPDFYNQAMRLAQIHLAEGTSSHVVTTDQVYNEFSGGSVDPTAIKWFAKMFYDRADGNISKMPENLLLFGDGTYDPKNRVPNNNYFIPTFQTQFGNIEDHINNMVTDDYFGMMDDNESLANSDMMDIGVGRMIVSNNEQAKQMVDKVVQYLKKGLNTGSKINCVPGLGSNACSSFGDWRLKVVQIADDEENGYFINKDTEPQYQIMKRNHPELNVDKLYLDAFPQVTTAGGDRYPDVYNGITERMNSGAIVVNYVGHGGEVGVAEERVITIPQIQSWQNTCNLPLFVSATCEFTKFDDPSRVSAGEWVYLNPNGGAIALMTTTRSVYFGVNTDVGLNFVSNAFTRTINQKSLTFGEIMRRTKNGASTTNSNKRSFNLIGDPALKIALPEFNILTDSINGHNASSYIDTLKALSRVTIKGHIANNNGQKINNFNGIIFPTIFDKRKNERTLGQDSDSPVIEYETQKNALFKGKVSVKNGDFEFSFIVPKDINYTFGLGKISYYANSETIDASGVDTLFYVGGINPNGINDVRGPEIDLFLNTEKFIPGGITDENPLLIAKIFDESGINMVGNGIGHDITAIIDNNTAKPIILNDYFSNELDSYQKGEINFQLRDLEQGKHTLTLKVWDVNNNSSESTIDFEVRKREMFSINHVLNYPNPFTTNTSFFFEHNQLCSNLEVMIQIMTISGKLVKTIRQDIFNDCFRSDGISWDGRDDFGDQLAKGVYIYRLIVKNPEGLRAEKIEKLVLLK